MDRFSFDLMIHRYGKDSFTEQLLADVKAETLKLKIDDGVADAGQLLKVLEFAAAGTAWHAEWELTETSTVGDRITLYKFESRDDNLVAKFFQFRQECLSLVS